MSAVQELLQLVNTANSRNYTLAQVQFGAPAVIDGATAGQDNTTVTVTGIEGAGYTGSKALTYKRLDLATQFAGHSLISKGPETAGTLQEVLDDIFAQTGVRIEPEDLSNAADVDFTQASVTLTAKAGSLKWIGSVEVATSTDFRDVSAEITVTSLPGFEYQTIPA